VLERYPRNAKLLRSYGQFLEHVKNDPWGAARYYRWGGAPGGLAGVAAGLLGSREHVQDSAWAKRVLAAPA
jgi:hypothetical protein